MWKEMIYFWSMQGTQSIASLSSGDLEDPDFSKEQDLELKCARAFKAVLHFEQTHCLQVEVRCWRCPAFVHHAGAEVLNAVSCHILTGHAQRVSFTLRCGMCSAMASVPQADAHHCKCRVAYLDRVC